VVKGIFEVRPGEVRYLVAHKIDGGWGELLHIYSEKNLRLLDETPPAIPLERWAWPHEW
jgi:hypothetical protein